MEIAWLGHSSLRIRSGGITLITDPYPDSLGISMGHPEADVVTISNGHRNHSNASAVGGDPRVLNAPGEYEIASFYVSGLGTRLGDDENDRKVNTVFTIRAEGLTLCHLGDLTQPLTARQADALRQTEVLFVPAGATCTIDLPGIAQLVNLIAPRIVIPLHYKIDGVNVDLQPLDGLLNELGATDVTPQNRLTVTATSLPRETRVIALQRTS